MTNHSHEMPNGYRGKILVVDDDAMVRELFARALARFGYQVALAGEGEAALNSYRRALADQSPFDLVLMDVLMPGMGGSDCAEHLLELDDEAKIVLMSGLRDPEVGELRARLLGVLEKPFNLVDLLTMLQADSGAGSLDGQSRPEAA